MSESVTASDVVVEAPTKCAACGSELVRRHARRPRAPGYTQLHCAACATGIERRAERRTGA